MKKLFNLILFALIMFSFLSKAKSQTQEQISYNKEYNDILYLCKESWDYLDKIGANKIKIYNSDDIVISSYSFKSSKENRDVYMDKIIYTLYTIDESITKIKIDNKIIDIRYNNIKTDMNKSILNCINKHANFCKKQNYLTHEQGEKTYNERLNESGITAAGNITENCSRTYKRGSIRMEIRRIFLAYYQHKYITEHWDQFMKRKYKYYTTAILVSDKDDYVYSVTIFTEYKTDKID